MFWWSWPSIIVETIGGLIAVLLTWPIPAAYRLSAATALSVIYERWLDRNKWSWLDVGQRSIAIAVGVSVLNVVHPG